MAFFKFRWPGQTNTADAPAKRTRAPQAESIEVMRRRARHRLMGAAVLVLLGVLGFPILFDTQPRPIPVDVPIEIPDRNKVAPLVVPERQSEAEAVRPQGAAINTGGRSSGERVAANAALGDGEELVTPSGSSARSTLRVVPQSTTAPPKSDVKPTVSNSNSSEKPTKPDELPRTKPTAEPRPAVAERADEERFIVQVGAFADAEKAKEVRAKLERAGLKTYTQVVDSKDGRRTRVRVGPYPTRADADKAAARIKTLELSASVLTL